MATASETTAPEDKKKQHRDPFREAIETVVFVVVLVLLLKLFVTEAFVIPTGSMAETLYGYQKVITCPKCAHEFPVNSHDEVEGQPGPNGQRRRQPLVDYVCPNCRHNGLIADLPSFPENRTGDRVLVLKPLYHLRTPERGDVVVFKFPKNPQENHVAANYIKRAMGFGGETVAIHRGDLYATTALEYPEGQLFPRPADPLDVWQAQYMYPNSGHAERLFDASRDAGFPAGPIKDLPPQLYAHFKLLLDEDAKLPEGQRMIRVDRPAFTVVRKGVDQTLADQRIVWDNDKQPGDLAKWVPPRWYDPAPPAASNWKGDNPDQPRAFTHSGAGEGWIRYRHLAWNWVEPSEEEKSRSVPPRFEPWRWPNRANDCGFGLVSLGMKASPVAGPIDNFLGYNSSRSGHSDASQRWVGDLSLECEAELPGGSKVILELSKGPNRYQAVFGDGAVSLLRKGPGEAEFGSPTRPCKVTAGTYKLRFANVDNQLRVWVDGKRIDFGTEGQYSPSEPQTYEPEDSLREGWTRRNDVNAPASIGAVGPVTNVRAIKLTRDIYYTWFHSQSGDHRKAEIYYVQPGHYMCLGDNSAHSSDSRDWGAVPERLMLGKAVFVFWPGYPRPNRVGFIK